jgi:hypothetical protein
MSPMPLPGADLAALTFLKHLAEIAPMFTAAAAMAGAAIAYLGLIKWHPESVGKRKVELAEDILAAVYRAREVISYARTLPFVNEGQTRPRREEETQEDAFQRDRIYVAIERLQKEDELFATLQSKKHRAIAYFGQEAAKPFDDLQKQRNEIITVAHALIGGRLSEEAGAQFRAIRWNIFHSKPDDVSVRVDGIIAEFDRLFGEWLRGKKRW